MAKSINRAQAELLATDFLDSIGSNPELSDLKLDETLISLIQLAGHLIDKVNENLNKGGHISTGALASSFKVLDPRLEGKTITLDIEALDYYNFLNKGVKGTRGGSGEYSFKTDYPSKKMVTAIADWIKRGGMSTRNTKKSVSKLERKNRSISQLDQAYAVARSIKMKGIKKTGYFDKAVRSAQVIAKYELGKSLVADVINSLPTKINDGISN